MHTNKVAPADSGRENVRGFSGIESDETSCGGLQKLPARTRPPRTSFPWRRQCSQRSQAWPLQL